MTIEKRGNQYCTVHCTGKDKGKVIKCFPTEEEANVQHSAIMASKHTKKIEIDTSEL
jgi:hypothetical protein